VLILISTDQSIKSNQIDSIRSVKTLTSRIKKHRGVRSSLIVEGHMASAVARVCIGVCGRSWSGELCPWSWKLFRIWTSNESGRICYLLYWLFMARCVL